MYPFASCVTYAIHHTRKRYFFGDQFGQKTTFRKNQEVRNREECVNKTANVNEKCIVVDLKTSPA